MFIVFEGIDGSGKTSLCTLVRDRLKQLQIISTMTSEFGRREGWSTSGRERLLASRNQQEELHVIMNVRCTHQENVLSPLLREGCVVLMDRYLMSTIAYQSNASISPGWLALRHKALAMPVPDKVFFLRIPVETAMQRLRNRGEKNRIDERPEAFFIQAAEAYAQSIPLLTSEGWDIQELDATAPLASLVDEVVKQVVSMCREAA